MKNDEQRDAKGIMSVSCQDCIIKRCHYCLTKGAFVIKVILLGDSGVGKSKLAFRFCYDIFSPGTFQPAGSCCPVQRRTIEIEGKTVKFDVHEFRVPLPAAEAASVYGQRPPIQKSTENLLGRRLYFRNIAGAMLVYDVTKRSTFEHVEYWRKQVREYAGYHSNVPILLVGTKCDLQNQIEVTMEEACIYAGKNSMSFIETSARNSTNVNTAFENLFKEVHCSKDVDDCSFFGRSRIDISNTRICGII